MICVGKRSNVIWYGFDQRMSCTWFILYVLPELTQDLSGEKLPGYKPLPAKLLNIAAIFGSELVSMMTKWDSDENNCNQILAEQF